jgi:tetratricopeptide (TPR) repeat protein
MTIEALLAKLREDLAFRRIESGFALLRKNAALVEALDPGQPHAGALLGFIAQWVDNGYAPASGSGLDLLRGLVARFPASVRGAMPLQDYAHLRMAMGLVAATDEGPAAAIAHFQYVLSVADDLGDREPLAIASFWIGRYHRMEGRYDDALLYTERGRDMALALGFAPMAAIMRLLESWLRFQKGRHAEARRILQDVQPVLESTGDAISVGNVHSAYGRIARREGRHERALEHFAASLREYQKRDPGHRNMARSLTNMAFVKRLIAIALAAKMDREAARRRRQSKQGRQDRKQSAREKERFEMLRSEAFEHLEAAEKIFTDARGLGNVHVNRGYLYLDTGQLDLAEREGAVAHDIGLEKKDYIMLARGRIMQSMVAVAQADEGIVDSQTAQFSEQAEIYAREAVEHARRTQNRRLLARAHVWHGLVLAGAHDLDAARECAEKAEALLRSETSLHGWDDLHDLKKRVMRAGSVDPLLREWSQGVVNGKSFRRVSDEFAAIVIPRVWEREGRKVSRVASKLKISPKKVRRILAGVTKKQKS